MPTVSVTTDEPMESGTDGIAPMELDFFHDLFDDGALAPRRLTSPP
jgi:hypothetical protein